MIAYQKYKLILLKKSNQLLGFLRRDSKKNKGLSVSPFSNFPVSSRNAKDIIAEIEELYSAGKRSRCLVLIKELRPIDNLTATYWQLCVDDKLTRREDPISDWNKLIAQCDKTLKTHKKIAFLASSKKLECLLVDQELDLAIAELDRIQNSYKRNLPPSLSQELAILFTRKHRFKECLEFLESYAKNYTGDTLASFQVKTAACRYFCNQMLSRENFSQTKNSLSEFVLQEMISTYHKGSGSGLLAEELLDFYQQMQKGDREILLDLKWNKLQIKKFRQKILDIVKAKKPFALVRVGDGDSYGFSLTAQDEYSKKVVEVTENLWWGKSFNQNLREKLAKNFLSAFSDIDMLGFPGPIRLARDLFVRDSDYMSTLDARHRDILLGGKKLLSEGRINNDCWWVDEFCNTCLNDSDYVKKLIDTAKNVVVVTSFKVPNESLLNNTKVKVIPIPSKPTKENLLDKNFAGAILPEIINDIESKVLESVGPGTLLIVSSGFAGKHLLSLGKRSGAVAIDFGSALDHFFGHKTRKGDFYSIFN